jgi:hypothetical protein
MQKQYLDLFECEIQYYYGLILKRIFFILIVSFISTLFGENVAKSWFIGLNPSVTVEPYYKKGEFDVNIFPLVVEYSIIRSVHLRSIVIVNYGVRTGKNSFSHTGLQLAVPGFPFTKSDLVSGIFIAPGCGFTRNIMEHHTNAGLWIEPGYSIPVAGDFRINLSIQFGATHFWYDNGSEKWGKHFGLKFIFGMWL